jgi:ATP-dependent RNA helicase RhlE
MFFQTIDQEVQTTEAVVEQSHCVSSFPNEETQDECFDVCEEIDFQHFVYLVSQNMKDALLTDILKNKETANAIIYISTNSAADKLAEYLNREGITAEAFHDNKSHRTGAKSLSNFKNNFTRILVVTDSAASGIDKTEGSLIVNYDLPLSAETYMKRLIQHLSLTGVSAKTFSLCDGREKGQLKNINRILCNKMQVIEHSFV